MNATKVWEYENDDAGLAGDACHQWLIVDDATKSIVATVPKTGDEDYDHNETFANVRLISAAPQLLAALQYIVAIADGEGEVAYTTGGHNRAVKAIAEALGN